MPAETYEAEGLEVPVETWGSGTDTLVFLPGLGCAPQEYARGLALAARKRRIVVLDLSFRGRADLPTSIEQYLRVVNGVCEQVAPGAPRAGHSFGGLLALLHPGPAIACAPSVPARVALPHTFGRAVVLQLREYVGLEGRAAVPYALRTTRDYIVKAVRSPRALFSITSALNDDPGTRPARAEAAVVYLCRRDEMYRRREYDGYFGPSSTAAYEFLEVDEGHDWPATHADRFAERIDAALESLARPPRVR
ncbi:MAG: alpha/beta fold hydrolase [Gemmatimonadota bacterium]